MNIKKIVLIIFTIALFLMLALYGALTDLLNDTSKIKNIEEVQAKLSQLAHLDKIIMQLQKERGLSAIFYNNKSKKYRASLDIQRKKTDLVIKKASKYLNTITIESKRQIAIQTINNHKQSRFVAFMNYTAIIENLLNQSELLILKTKNSDIKNSLFYYEHLNIMQEATGELRGLVGGILVSKKISRQEYEEIIILNRLFEENYNIVQGKIQLKLLLTNKDIQETFHIVNKIVNINTLKGSILTDVEIKPLKWFKIASHSVNLIRESTIKEIAHIEHIIEISKQIAQDRRMRHLLLWCIGSLFLFVAIFISFLLSKKLLEEQRLLKNYKNVIDNSPNSIVSKTDKKGRITYVNDNFCRISKYSVSELLGKSHNIVRHPDVDSAVFKDFWKTIKSGKVWSGIVKNKAKDGTPYWVDASISPIFDGKGKLVEYIAMRHDITDMVLQKEKIERTQKELIYRMGEAVEARSKESGNHIKRVSHYSKILALLAGLDEEEAESLFIASSMHDIGKIAIPDVILLKPGKLDSEEYKIMQTHSEIGYALLSGSDLPLLKIASIVAYEHHEHFNGSGFPQGLKGNEISIYSRIVSIVDVFDALVSDRIYKKAWELEKVLEFFKEHSSTQFDPILVKLFIENIDKFMRIKEQFEDI